VLTIDAPTQAVATAIAYAEQQLGKPYLWGGTGPDAFDCSGLMMMAYRAAGINIARTSEQQWATEPRVKASQVEPGDLVFFAGADGTRASPGHVGLVIGNGKMIEAYATGFPIRVASYTNRDPVGFTRPWATATTSLRLWPAGPVFPAGLIPAGRCSHRSGRGEELLVELACGWTG
jgi:cell wall-associated NlpC family hydrolase